MKLKLLFDWNLYGNALFLLGSLLYVFSSVLAYFPEYYDMAVHVNLAASLVFVVDALCYIAGWCAERHIRLKRRGFHHLVQPPELA